MPALLALAALLQTSPAPAAPPPPAAALTPRAEAEALLARARAADVFADETAADARGPGAIRLRHRPSGFLCRLDPGAHALVQVFGSLDRGSDVRCTQFTPAGMRSEFIYRAPDKPLTQLASDAEREVRAETHDDPAAPTPADRRTVPAAGATPEHTVLTVEGASLTDRYVLGKVGDWAVQLRLLRRGAADAPSSAFEAEWTAALADRAAPAPLAAAAARPPLSPAAARAEAERLLAAGGPAAGFEIVENGAVPTLRHRASGARCAFEPGAAENELTVLPRDPRGSDLKCVTRLADGLITVFLSRVEPTPTLQAAFAGFVREIRAAHPDAQPYTGQSGDVRIQDAAAPEHAIARFVYSREGRPVFSRLEVAMLNGWIVEQRLDGPPDKAFALDVGAGLSFMSTLGVVGKGPPLPLPPTPRPPADADVTGHAPAAR